MARKPRPARTIQEAQEDVLEELVGPGPTAAGGSHPTPPHVMKAPTVLAATVNAAAGHVVVDWWGQLDPARAEKQLNAFAGFSNFRQRGPLDRGITDPHWSPDEFAHACGLSTS